MATFSAKTNYSKSILAGNLAIDGLSFTITTGDGAKFPATGSGNYFWGVFWSASDTSPFADTAREIVKCYRNADDTFTITNRAQEGTAAKAWSTGDNFMLTLTAATITEITDAITSESLWDRATTVLSPQNAGDSIANISTYNGLTLTSAATGFTIAGGTTSKTLTVPLDASVSGTNTGDGTYGIASTNYVKIDAADVADNDYAKFTANGLEGRSYSEVKQDLDLEVGTDIAAQTHASQHAVSGSDSVFPADPGADRYLMWDDDPGQLVWATVSGTGASTALDNLASVAINTSLISDTTNTDDLGSSTKLWKDLFVTNIGATATRVTKGWFTDLEITNTPTIGGNSLATIYAAIGQTFYIGTTQVAINRASAALTLAGITLTAPTFDTSATGSYLTASEILITDADKKIVSAPVATYPSLTELSYVKGVSSAIQTQIGNKANSASPTFTGTITLADNCRIDLTLPTADGYATGPTTDSFNAGYSSAVGDLVYFGTGGKWLECDADAIATAGSLLGIALEAKTDGQAMKVALPGSMVRIDAWNWNVGKALYAGETLGALSESIPTGADGVVRVVGFSLSADVIFFNPSSDHSTTVA